MPKKETSVGRDGKGKDKDAGEKALRKEPTTSQDAKNKEDSNVSLNYELNSKVLCKHRDSLYYEAKIIAIDKLQDKGKIFTVHYQGWNSRHDEKIAEEDAAARFLPCTEENLEMARMEMQEARLLEKKKKGKKVSGMDDKKSEGADSRSSTPSVKVPKPSSFTASEKGVTPSSTSRKRKLANSEPEVPIDTVGVPKPEVKIEIPNGLKDILVDDQDMITRQMHLVQLPARINVQDIIKQYAEHTGVALNGENELSFEHSGSQTKMSKDTLIESSHGVQDYFDTTLGSQLLYKFERPQYAELYEKKTGELDNGVAEKQESTSETAANGEEPPKKKWKPSDTYGFIHLLRLFVRFSSMLKLTSWSDRAMANIVEHVHDFLGFLDKNRHSYYDMQKDYIVASPEYQKRVWNA